MVENVFFRWTGIAVAERPLGIFMTHWITRGPTVRPQVANIQIVTRAHGAHRIPDIARARIRMTLAFQIHCVTRAEFFFAGQQTEETVAGHFWQRLQSAGSEESGSEVHQIDKIVANLARFDTSR